MSAQLAEARRRIDELERENRALRSVSARPMRRAHARAPLPTSVLALCRSAMTRWCPCQSCGAASSRRSRSAPKASAPPAVARAMRPGRSASSWPCRRHCAGARALQCASSRSQTHARPTVLAPQLEGHDDCGAERRHRSSAADRGGSHGAVTCVRHESPSTCRPAGANVGADDLPLCVGDKVQRTRAPERRVGSHVAASVAHTTHDVRRRLSD